MHKACTSPGRTALARHATIAAAGVNPSLLQRVRSAITGFGCHHLAVSPARVA